MAKKGETMTETFIKSVHRAGVTKEETAEAILATEISISGGKES